MRTPTTILVVDIEATCWDDHRVLTGQPGSRNEIIEVGVTPLDIATRTLGETASFLVHPPTTEIGAFCTTLTTITPALVAREGRPLGEVIDLLRRTYQSDRAVFASYGDYDRKMFEKNCTWQLLPYPFGHLHLNVKALVAAQTGRTGGVGALCAALGFPFDGTPHRGGDDSRMIAKILQHLLGPAPRVPAPPTP